MGEFTPEHSQALLALARESVRSHWQSENRIPEFEGENRYAATFVTLTKAGQLRGCIGSLVPQRKLLDDIQHNSRAAAFHDPRFLPVDESEMDDIRFEISVLTEAKSLDFKGRDDLLNKLTVGIDGVILEYNGHRATFLPQVWEQLATPEVFLQQLLLKAGLPASTPLEEVSIAVYQVESFEE